jgi:hypothetical protein
MSYFEDYNILQKYYLRNWLKEFLPEDPYIPNDYDIFANSMIKLGLKEVQKTHPTANLYTSKSLKYLPVGLRHSI